MNQKSRSLTIDATKGMAILLVMVGHVLVWNHMEDGIIYDVIKVIQMPLFILVSGYLCGMGRKISSLSAYGAKLKKRALSYLTPFFFWIVLQHPLHPVTNIVETLFGLDKGLWFLMTLFLLTLMVYTAELAGAVAERSFGALGGKIVFWAVYLGLAAAVLLDLQDVTTLLLLGRQIIASFLGCAAVCWLLWKCGPNRFKKFLAWLGGYTLEIYVVHFHFATVLNRGQVYAQYSAGWFLFVLASFIAMSAITAAIIAVTKRVRLLDFLLYGKWPAEGRFFGKVQE